MNIFKTSTKKTDTSFFKWHLFIINDIFGKYSLVFFISHVLHAHKAMYLYVYPFVYFNKNITSSIIESLICIFIYSWIRK